MIKSENTIIVKIFECPKCGFVGQIDERLNTCICGNENIKDNIKEDI
jgi:ribosomal protein S27AE